MDGKSSFAWSQFVFNGVYSNIAIGCIFVWSIIDSWFIPISMKLSALFSSKSSWHLILKFPFFFFFFSTIIHSNKIQTIDTTPKNSVDRWLPKENSILKQAWYQRNEFIFYLCKWNKSLLIIECVQCFAALLRFASSLLFICITNLSPPFYLRLFAYFCVLLTKSQMKKNWAEKGRKRERKLHMRNESNVYPFC